MLPFVLKVFLGFLLRNLWFRFQLPVTEGTVYVESSFCESLNDGIKIVRDNDGVPHIYGNSSFDVFFGQGYVQAQDRLLQLEILRRFALGRLSELDEKFLLLDRLSRTFGFGRKGKKDVDVITPEERKDIESYINGINCYISSSGAKPLELRLSSLGLEYFVIEEYLAVLRLMGWEMNMSGWMSKLINEVLSGILSPEDFEIITKKAFKKESDVKHWFSGKHNEVNEDLYYKSMDYEKIKELEKISSDYKGSNCFVISGNLTNSGKPILASDPHLETNFPNVWYRNHIKTTDGSNHLINAAGVTMVGLFGITIGHNGFISYGMTLSCSDMYDIYREQIDTKKDKYFYEGEWKTMNIIEERIKVKGKEDWIEKVEYTHHGPILSNVWNYESSDDLKRSVDYVLKYSVKAASIVTEPYPSVVNLCKAKNWEEFLEIGKKGKAASFNICYADKYGNIGYFMTGGIPLRTKEAIENSHYVMDGTKKEFEWNGFADTSENPQCLNPSSGYVISSNQKIVDDSYKYYLGDIFFSDGRSKRIRNLIFEKLGEKEKQGLPKELDWMEIAEIQRDVVIENRSFIQKIVSENLENKDFTKIYNVVAKEFEEEISEDFLREISNRIKEFDGNCVSDSVDATLYVYFQNRLLQTLLESNPELQKNTKLQEAVMGSGIHRLFYSPNEYTMKDRIVIELLFEATNNKKPNSLIVQGGGKDVIVLKALFKTILALRKMNPGVANQDYSKELENYKYGKLHQLVWEHPLQDFTDFNIGPFEISGSRETVAVFASFDTVEISEENKKVGGYPSLRFIVDMAKVDESRIIITPGQSSNPASKHYDDFVDTFLRNEFSRNLYLDEDIEKEKESTLWVLKNRNGELNNDL